MNIKCIVTGKFTIYLLDLAIASRKLICLSTSAWIKRVNHLKNNKIKLQKYDIKELSVYNDRTNTHILFLVTSH